MKDLTEPIAAANRIYKRLRRVSGSPFLSGWCAIASLTLCTEIGDLDSFRAHDDHAWNQFGNVVVDITAAQFHGYGSKVSVYVGSIAWYHLAAVPKSRVYKGVNALRRLVRQGWYAEDDEDFDPIEIRRWQLALRPWERTIAA